MNPPLELASGDLVRDTLGQRTCCVLAVMRGGVILVRDCFTGNPKYVPASSLEVIARASEVSR